MNMIDIVNENFIIGTKTFSVYLNLRIFVIYIRFIVVKFK